MSVLRNAKVNPSSIEAYLFDLGNVIVDIHVDQFLPELGLDGRWSLDEALQVYERSGLSREFELGNISFDEFYERSCDLFGVDVEKETFLRAWNAIIGNEKPAMGEIVEACAKRAPVYLLSNTNDPHYRHALQKAPSLHRMNGHYLSYKLNLLKPDPRIYTEVVDRIGVPVGCVFFTDDRQENIASARDVGLQAIRFDSPEQLKSILDI